MAGGRAIQSDANIFCRIFRHGARKGRKIKEIAHEALQTIKEGYETMAVYKLGPVRLTQRGGQYVVCIDGEPEAGGTYENPIEAWTRFIDSADSRVRRRIGDLLEKQGRNRYTGALEQS
ncbi:hypothetical protein D7Y41_26685 [Anaerotruncus sp. 1XD22-93]|nr:hypothetical protein [Anaerotruncus sp. 1XD42-93]RKJ80343.1 hypothetical protein D7Y41_26685 [Anaerotruncus sp. 1XD22-93]